MLSDHVPRQIEGLLTSGSFDLAARDKEERSQTALPGHSRWTIEQALVVRLDSPALQPDTGYFDMLQQASSFERLSSQRLAQCAYIPAHKLGVRC